ncbi:MAG: hypothetical protein PHF72_02530 [Gammaproteobacteria bacterium]|nr:hypothetical protein [Gammaproteobacteria bacterium]
MDVSGRRIGLRVMGAMALIFGLLTVVSGGQVLFGAESHRVAAGDYVGFVVWFNFLAGFAYIAAGIGLWLGGRWAVWLSLFIAVATLAVFALFGMHVLQGGRYEMRTVAAMTLRTAVWWVLFLLGRRLLSRAAPA